MSALIPLAEAGVECGGKAYQLGVLLRHGFDVPDGFIVMNPAETASSPADSARPDAAWVDSARSDFAWLGGPVAVRSSGMDEDSAEKSFAGQYETILGPRDIRAAVAICAASGRSRRAVAYRSGRGVGGSGPPEADDRHAIPVLVQELVPADKAGVLFTRDPRTGDDTTVINACWGLGQSVVSGEVEPDEIVGGVVRAGSKETRLDLVGHELVRTRAAGRGPCLDTAEIAALTEVGRRVEDVLGGPQDIEWAIAGGRIRILQARPITALGPVAPPIDARKPLVAGYPSGPGVASGVARVLRGVDDFSRLRDGDVLVCRTTDPAWTPLFRIASAVVTESGGVLSHAAIVAREYGIPAVVGAAGALTLVPDGAPVTVDGSRGTVSEGTG